MTDTGVVLIAGLLLLAVGFGLLSWCSIELGLVNPGKRVPGRLPAVEHPRGYMPVGAAGLSSVVLGAAAVFGSPNIYAWIVATGIGAVAIAGPFAVHNRRLR